MPHHQYNRERCTVSRPNPRVLLPISLTAYQEVSRDATQFRAWLDTMIARYPELFPATIAQGYVLHGILPPSTKEPEARFRRIKLRNVPDDGTPPVLTIAASAVMPYMTGRTDDVAHALFLRQFGVPFWGLTHVFGHNDSYWQRLEAQFGRVSIVHTTVKDAATLPTHLVADEKHTHQWGDPVYIAVTAGGPCVLGASVATQADGAHVQAAYGVFRAEAHVLQPDYTPATVNTDGWAATQAAWRTLFPKIVVLLCFLHAWLRIRERCQRVPDLAQAIATRVWAAYRATTAPAFHAQVGALQAWAAETLTGERMATITTVIAKLVANEAAYAQAYAHPDAYRTSNLVDRLIDPLDRWLVRTRGLHGHWASAERSIRAWALMQNFLPYCPRVKRDTSFQSPMHHLNGFVYHDHWLHNLLIASSCAGIPTTHRKR